MKNKDTTKWYDCARCDAGYDSGPLEQECTCTCEHGVSTIKECIICTMKSMNPENFLLKEYEIETIEFLKELDQKCECFCRCSQKTDGTCNLCDQCIDECDPYEKPW